MDIYLDHNASSIIDEDIILVMQEAQKNFWGNPSSVHALGRKAKAKYLNAKDTFSRFFLVQSKNVFFLSSATEAINWILFQKSYKHIVSSDLEHAAIFNSLKILEKQGTPVTFISPQKQGFVDAAMLQNALTEETDLIILGAANSETGIIQDIGPLAQLAKSLKIPIIVDAVGLLSKAPFSVDPNVEGYIISSHKIHGPKGIACLIHKEPKNLNPLAYGGYQESAKKAGTENLPAAMAFSASFEKLMDSDNFEEIKRLKTLFETRLREHLDISIVGSDLQRVDNTSCIRFHDISAETLLTYLDHAGIYASHGSACSSGALEPSRVLLNMGYSPKEAKEMIRFSLSKYTTKAEIIHATEQIIAIVSGLKQLLG